MGDNSTGGSFDDSYYSESQRNFKQQVWDNYRHGESHCQGCPVRNPDVRPNHSAFDTDSDLMIVAEARGVGTGGARALDNKPPKHEWEELPSKPRFEEYDRRIAEKYSQSGGEQSYLYVQELMDKERIPLGVTEVFFTNAIKCGKTDNWNTDRDARDHCLPYLEEEIEELVEPDVIVPMGDHAIRAVDDVVDFSQYTNTRQQKALYNNHGEDGTFPILQTREASVQVIPAHHWSHLSQYISQNIGWAEDQKEYWEKLGERITTALGVRG